MEKVRYQPQFDKEDADKIKHHASKVGAKPSPYIAEVVRAHIKKQEGKPNQSKKEYGDGKI